MEGLAWLPAVCCTASLTWFLSITGGARTGREEEEAVKTGSSSERTMGAVAWIAENDAPKMSDSETAALVLAASFGAELHGVAASMGLFVVIPPLRTCRYMYGSRLNRLRKVLYSSLCALQC